MPTTNVYRRLLGYTPWVAFFLSLFGFLLYSVANVSVVQLVAYLVDSLQESVEGLDSLKEWIGLVLGTAPPSDQALVPVAIIAIVLIRGIGTFLGTYYIAFAANQMIFKLRIEVFDRFLTLPVTYYDQNSSGHLVAKLTYHVTQVTGAATDAVKILFRDGLTVVGYLGYLFYLNWRLTLLFLIAAPFIGLLARIAGRRFRKISERIQDSMGDVTQVATEAIQGYREVRTFGGEPYEQDRFQAVSERNRRQSMKMVMTSAIATPVIQLLVSLVLAMLVWLLLEPAIRADMSTGDVVAFITTGGLLAKPIRQLTEVIAIVQRGIAAAADLFDVLDQPTELDEGTTRLDQVDGHIRFDNVTFQYASADSPVLESLNFEIQAGETIALVGPSGGGKTTLASLIARFYEPSSGDIYLDHIPLREIERANLRNHLAVVSQSVTLFNDSIARNIAYGGLSGASADAVREAARDAQALEFIEALPYGFDTLVGDNGVLLSGGQRQRLAIARALLKDAPLLILDEATSALDTDSERAFQSTLERLIAGRTTVIIAHRLSTVEKADRIFVLVDGQIVEEGTHAELLEKGAHYSRYFDQQADETLGANGAPESEAEPIDTSGRASTKSLERWVTEGWYADGQWTRWLLPFSWVFRGISSLRAFWLRKRSYEPSVPVIVVGNLTVGGTGKTPVVAGLVDRLRARGKRPGIVSRGHLGSKNRAACLVDAQATASEVGDEVVMLKRQLDVPIAIGRNRAEAVQLLEEEGLCDVIVSDDGLQRYDLGRQYEIAVIDGQRRFGNGQLLPAGPLREASGRLDTVDSVLVNITQGDYPVSAVHADQISFSLKPTALFESVSKTQIPLADLDGLTLRAVSAIGNPERFRATLEALGANVLSHDLDDHQSFVEGDLTFADDLPIVITEKDFSRLDLTLVARLKVVPWVLCVEADFPEALIDNILAQLEKG